MKHITFRLWLGIAVLALPACDTMGNVDTAPPYALERTATHTQAPKKAPEPAAPIILADPAPAAAPMCSCECGEWEDRARQAELQLAQCKEVSERLRASHDQMLRK